ncbi:unnamed protein product [Plutella xylostella]|uniref:(diamondback moth) hypothetical protein n=1 Tax=Plutella xylostella TaxID=51655 RepID=A0A8S4G3G3_PLUXY|nr:unnamed protein product [Plutella xylostella]
MTAWEWSSLPLLPLKCVLDYLSISDVLAATAACRNWRYALALYEGKRETLKLTAKDVPKSIFLSRLFKDKATRLEIYVDCSGDDLDNFFQIVLPIFYEPSRLTEIVFVARAFINEQKATTLRLQRPITENLIHAHRNTLQSLALFGCEMSSLKDDNIDGKELSPCSDQYFDAAPSLLPPQYSLRPLAFSSIRHLTVDITTLDGAALDAISSLRMRRLSVCVSGLCRVGAVPWREWRPPEMDVTIINVSTELFPEIMENILTDDIPVVAFRVMFCKVLYEPIIKHVANNYHSILREFQYVDAPHCGPRPAEVVMDPETYEDPCVINPFILVCWRCTNLRKMVIHGYWIWQYDLLGMVRLRHNTLQEFEVSAVFSKDNRTGCSSAHCMMPAGVRRVVRGDRAKPKDDCFVRVRNNNTLVEMLKN